MSDERGVKKSTKAIVYTPKKYENFEIYRTAPDAGAHGAGIGAGRLQSRQPTGAAGTVLGVAGMYAAEAWYTVDGRKLYGEPTQKGVYIVNGRKVVIK